MAVVINDFEVVTDSTQSGRGASGSTEERVEAQGGSGAPSAPTPNDIRRVLRRQLERIERVRAD
ncbi:MAG TPA: hypothetical protein VIW80_21615 [Pyrinomonadaceae bacterium]|jgi:hypothetical protein